MKLVACLKNRANEKQVANSLHNRNSPPVLKAQNLAAAIPTHRPKYITQGYADEPHVYSSGLRRSDSDS